MKLFILLNSITFFLFGLGFTFFPESLSMTITDGTPVTTSGLTDMRATYGGISLGAAILLFLISRNNQLLSLGTLGCTLISGGMAFGRVIGMIQDGSPNEFMYINLALELLIVIVGTFLLLRSDKLD